MIVSQRATTNNRWDDNLDEGGFCSNTPVGSLKLLLSPASLHSQHSSRKAAEAPLYPSIHVVKAVPDVLILETGGPRKEFETVMAACDALPNNTWHGAGADGQHYNHNHGGNGRPSLSWDPQRRTQQQQQQQAPSTAGSVSSSSRLSSSPPRSSLSSFQISRQDRQCLSQARRQRDCNTNPMNHLQAGANDPMTHHQANTNDTMRRMTNSDHGPHQSRYNTNQCGGDGDGRRRMSDHTEETSDNSFSSFRSFASSEAKEMESSLGNQQEHPQRPYHPKDDHPPEPSHSHHRASYAREAPMSRGRQDLVRHNSAHNASSARGKFVVTRGADVPVEAPGPRRSLPRRAQSLHNPIQQQQQPSPSPSSPPSNNQVEIAPGLFMFVRGTDETMDALQCGNVSTSVCMLCSSIIKCIADAEYVLCPVCKVVSPLDTYQGGVGGVGLGVQA